VRGGGVVEGGRRGGVGEGGWVAGGFWGGGGVGGKNKKPPSHPIAVLAWSYWLRGHATAVTCTLILLLFKIKSLMRTY